MMKNSKQNNMKSTEYLSKDIIDEDLLRSFAPTRYWQLIIGTCRVDCRDRFVTTPTLYQRLYSIFLLILVLLIQFQFIEVLNVIFHDYQTLYIISVVMIYVQVLIYSLTIIDVRFVHNEKHKELYIKMQDLDNFIKNNNKKSLYDCIYKLNIVTVTTILMTLLLPLLSSFEGFTAVINMTIMFYTDMTILFEITHYSNLMVYFAMHLRCVNRIIKNHLKEEFKENIIDLAIPLSSGYYGKELFQLIEMKNCDLRSFDVHIYLKKVLNVFSYYQNIYMFQAVRISCFADISLLFQNYYMRNIVI
ncbi:uncharacterized protein LOC131841387 isoform X2 [Achroia grisella]|uniref:uncharacterized protein LOC131841387 isoform X2 n=1 Tax=Achroia grisella TaxID=688607 RepID=UPI0027D1EA28|nr:uncharacterized protein LOC131841387 isoform X2 [Achroia grisella]